MCVLTYIPTENNGFILTSNRDEAVSREPAIPPRKYHLHGQNVFFPKDPKGGGTWIASCGNFTLCLLNGGFEKHIPQPPYRQSRGKVILDFYEYQNVNEFVNQYLFDGIEPFTLIIIENIGDLIIHELRWDAHKIFVTPIDATQSHIWSSATLYSPKIRLQREQWFRDFLVERPNRDSILDFHHFGGKEDIRNGIKMNRDNKLQTISITQFVIDNDEFVISYHDLQIDNKFQYRIFRELVS
ncbi:MAG: NRDE family protein [Spirosomataceae bacterium]